MRLRAAAVAAVLTGTLASAAPQPVPVELTEGGEAYLKAIRGRDIQAEVTYYDPRKAPPPLQIDIEVETPEEQSGASDRLKRGLVAGALLLGALALILWFGGGRTVSLARRRDGQRRPGPTKAAPPPAEPSQAPDLSAIVNMADRRQALIALGQAALERAARANGLHPGRSWTARDTLRRIPPRWPHLPALKCIAGAAELTHFGGRDVSEDDWAANLSLARPIFAEGSR